MKTSREKEQKQQHINAVENILPKGYTTEDVRNYGQKSSRWLDSSVAWNSLHFGISNICSCQKDARHAINIPERKEFHVELLSSQSDDFWS